MGNGGERRTRFLEVAEDEGVELVGGDGLRQERLRGRRGRRGRVVARHRREPRPRQERASGGRRGSELVTLPKSESLVAMDCTDTRWGLAIRTSPRMHRVRETSGWDHSPQDSHSTQKLFSHRNAVYTGLDPSLKAVIGARYVYVHPKSSPSRATRGGWCGNV